MFKKISQNYIYKFDIEVSGLYVIEIEAACQSAKIFGFWDGQDLKIEIDSRKFREAPAVDRPQFFNIPVSWNGTKLKGKSKTVFFVLNLEKGKHVIKFIPRQGAVIKKESVITKFSSRDAIIKNMQSDDRNRAPWITIALIDLPLDILDVSAKCEKRKRDSDDLKLIIDGRIEKNKDSGWWGKNWYFQGRFLKGDVQESRFYPKLEKGIHYIEFWADRMPILNSVKINVSEQEDVLGEEFELEAIHKYDQFHGLSGNEDYDRFDREIKSAVDFWNDKFLSEKYPVQESLDPNLVKAIIYKESRAGYFKGGEVDVMQVGDARNPAMKTLTSELPEWWMENGQEVKLNYKEEYKLENPEDSIYWGVRWLYHKAQGIRDGMRYWKSWEQAVIDYNGSDKKQEYKDYVWRIYEDGIDGEGNVLYTKKENGFGKLRILFLVLCGFFIFFLGAYFDFNCNCSRGLWGCNKYEATQEKEYGKFSSLSESNNYVSQVFKKNLEEYKKDLDFYGNVFQETKEECDKNNCAPELIFSEYYNELVNNLRGKKQFLEAMNYFSFLGIEEFDIDNDGKNEAIFIRDDYLNREFVVISIIDEVNGKYALIERREEGYDAYFKLLDVTGDLRPELLLFRSRGRAGYPLYIYQYSNDKTMRVLSFESDFVWYPEYVFADTNNNGRMEIILRGEEKDVTNDYHAFVEYFFEYDPISNSFLKK